MIEDQILLDKYNMDALNESFTNGTRNETTVYEVHASFSIVKVAIISMWSSMVLIPNYLVFAVLILKSQLRKNHRTEFILWLCVSDLLNGVTSVMYLLTNVVSSLATSPNFCTVTLFFVYSGVTLSLVYTFLLCYERYLAVVRKIKFQLLRKRKKYLLIFGSWIIVSLYIGTMAVSFLRVDKIDFCGIQNFPNGKYYMVSASLVCFPTLILIGSFYISFVIRLKQQMRKTYATSNQFTDNINIAVLPADVAHAVPTTRHAEQTFVRKEREVTTTVGFIVASLFLFSGPFVVTKFLEGLSIVTFRPAVRTTISFLAGSNSIFNPVLYAWRIPAFRKELRNIFNKCSW